MSESSVSDVFKQTGSPLRQVDLPTYKTQEIVFIGLNMALLVVLLTLHTVFASYWGLPTRALVRVIEIAFVANAAKLIWVRSLATIAKPRVLISVTWASVIFNICLALLLSELTDHEDSPYFVLMISPILEAAFRFRFPAVISTVSVANFFTFFWIWDFYRHHPPLDIGEYYEAGITSLTFLVVAVVTWWLVNDGRVKGARLARNLQELERTREKLLQEERLAAVGRFSSAIAHELRNPVSMIASSIATAKQLEGKEREEMFAIAAEEAQRLVTLTTDFLAYARPRSPKLEHSSVTDTIHYVADACRAHARQKSVQVQVQVTENLTAFADSGQLQQALINLIVNAIDAAPANSTVNLRAYTEGNRICIDVDNAGESLSIATLSRIFEPFFTTKPKGSGLGLSIARNIARAHGGDVILTGNGPERICFCLSLPIARPAALAARI
jgi:two-component system, NtrC family, sensor histidine kinase HydH